MRTEFGFEIEKREQTRGLVKQVHGTRTVLWTEPTDAPPIEADGVVTDRPGTSVFVFTADCIPVLLEDLDHPRVAALHAGWRGARDGIISQTLAEYFSQTRRLRVILGPCILDCCFEVRSDFTDSFHEREKPVAPFLKTRNGRDYFDLVAFVRQEELRAFPDAIVDTTLLRCTCCSAPPLPSYRRSGNTDVRLRTWISLIA